MRIVSTKEMDIIEKQTFDEFCMKEDLIIENVGIRVANRVIENYLKHEDISTIFLIGKGNNGADGLAAARHLSNKGYDCRAFMVFSESEYGEKLDRQIKMAHAFGVKLNFLEDFESFSSFFYQIDSQFLVVDAIFGTGVRLPLPNFIYDVINFVNEQSQAIVSIDIPSGIGGDTGEVMGNAIKANATYAIGLPKIGCYMGDGFQHSGEIEVIDAGFPSKLLEKGKCFHIDRNLALETAKHRDEFGDKKIFGHTLVVGGSHGLTGALVLCSQSVLKVGTGLVTGATWEPQYQEFLSRLAPEVMTGYIPTDESKWDKVVSQFSRYDSIVIGPGLGVSARARRAVLKILSTYDGPVVIDADAINVLNYKEDREIFRNRRASTVITPHTGEFSRFLGVSREEITKNPVEFVQKAISEFNISVVLKGPCTYLGFPSGQKYFHLFPNAGMATGGSGDVLAGILGGLMAQDRKLMREDSAFDSTVMTDKTVVFGVYIHSRAGHFAAKNLGKRAMTASSIIQGLSDAFSEIRGDFHRK
jgi:NAD(P)H-hydrate epimerase